MKHVILFSIFFCFLLCTVHAQNFRWAHSMNGPDYDALGGPIADSDGSVYMLGSFQGTIDLDPGPGIASYSTTALARTTYILKLDSSGNFKWVKVFNDPGLINGATLALDKNRNIYLVGHFSGTYDFDPGPGTYTVSSYNGYSAFTLKLDSTGQFIWVKTIGNLGTSVVYADIEIDALGQLYITGEFNTAGNASLDFDPGISNTSRTGDNDAFLVKWDSLGNFLWVVTYYTPYNGGNKTGGLSVEISKNSEIYVAGYFNDGLLPKIDFDPGPGVYTLTSYGQEDIFISKLDMNGNFIWAKSFGGPGMQFPGGMEVDDAGSVSIAGTYWGICDFDPGPNFAYIAASNERDVFISRYDTNGSLVWAKSIGGFGADECTSMALDSMGNIYVAGGFVNTADFDPGPAVYTLSCGSNYDAFVLKLDSNGIFQWANSIKSSVKSVSWGHLCVSQNRDLFFAGQFSGTVDLNPDYAKMLVSGKFMDGFILKLGPCNNVLAISGPTNLCVGQCATLTVAPGLNYSWSDTLAVNNTLIDCPNQNKSYSVWTQIAENCAATGVHSVAVGTCVGERENEISNLSIYPVPAHGEIRIVSFLSREISIFNQLGQRLKVQLISAGETAIDIATFAPGIYYIRDDRSNSSAAEKIIIY